MVSQISSYQNVIGSRVPRDPGRDNDGQTSQYGSTGA